MENKDDITALMPEVREIKLSFGTFKIEPLGVGRIARLFLLLKKFPKNLVIMANQKERPSNIEFAFELVEIFAGKIPEGLTILLDSETPVIVKDINVPDTFILMKAMIEVNDVELINQTFSAAMLTIKEKFPKAIESANKMFAEKTTLTSS